MTTPRRRCPPLTIMMLVLRVMIATILIAAIMIAVVIGRAIITIIIAMSAMGMRCTMRSP